MLLRKCLGLVDKTLNLVLLLIFSLIGDICSVKVSQLLSHLAEEAVFERLELAEGEDLTFAGLRPSGSLALRFGPLNEVKHVAFLFLSDLALGDVLEHSAK